jgi:hypothetical protein
MLTFVETNLFSRLADEYLGEEGLLALQENIPTAILREIRETIDG